MPVSSPLQSRAYKIADNTEWMRELTELCVSVLVFVCVRNRKKQRQKQKKKTDREKRKAKSHRGCGNSFYTEIIFV